VATISNFAYFVFECLLLLLLLPDLLLWRPPPRHRDIEPFLPGIAEDFGQYLEAMSQPGVWGGEHQQKQ
jgi:hypothetical protein